MRKQSSTGLSSFFSFLTSTSVPITVTPLSDSGALPLLSSRILPAEAGEDSQMSSGRCNTTADWVQITDGGQSHLSLSGPCLMTCEVIDTWAYVPETGTLLCSTLWHTHTSKLFYMLCCYYKSRCLTGTTGSITGSNTLRHCMNYIRSLVWRVWGANIKNNGQKTQFYEPWGNEWGLNEGCS